MSELSPVVPGGEHMADIKHGGVLASPDVGGTDTEVRVLDGHGPTSERDHLATVLDMVIVKDSLLEDLVQEREIGCIGRGQRDRKR